jgi:hypothetical protein
LSDTWLSQCIFIAFIWKPSLELDLLIISKTLSLNFYSVPFFLQRTSLVTLSIFSRYYETSLAFALSFNTFIYLLLLCAACTCSLEPVVSSNFPGNGSVTTIVYTSFVVFSFCSLSWICFFRASSDFLLISSVAFSNTITTTCSQKCIVSASLCVVVGVLDPRFRLWF